MHYPVRFRATIQLRSTEDSGRQRPIATGYRPNFWLKIPDAPDGYGFTGASIELIDRESLGPGESGAALLRPFREDQWAYLDVGDTVEFFEPPRPMGTATITQKF